MTLPNSTELVKFLNDLFDTNTQFANDHAKGFFEQFSEQQNPHLTVLKCSDSRVQMESFDKTPQNGVFAVRNIGNQVKTCEGSIEFGVEVLNTPFLLILGHSNCGAVKAVIEKETNIPSCVRKELDNLKLHTNCLHEAIVENINNQVAYASKKYHNRIKAGKLTIIGAIYDFKNDFNTGHGKLILTNINNITDQQIIRNTYGHLIQNVNLL